MTSIKKTVRSTDAPRQRRPAFDREKGIEIAQNLFHERGYDAVSVADLTAALNINPPSLYAAYGSKLALFERALVRYTETDFLAIEEIFASDRPAAEVLTDLFRATARHYTRETALRGCMVTEAMRADDEKAAAVAAALAAPAIDVIRSYIARYAAQKDVERILDYVILTLRGISSYACMGATTAKLVDCAGIAGRALDSEFPPVSSKRVSAKKTA
ncbi:TetR/AcrR family transcriptional repressor for divergent bdcA [Luteibacter sp. HA06]|jgi:TetR/AcrR family transcriptional repressor for divergent bdcA